MSEEIARLHQPAAEVSEEALARAEEMIEREEGVQNKLAGALAAFVTLVAVAMSLFHLYAAYAIVRPEHLRAIHVAFVLFLTLPHLSGGAALPPPRDVVGLGARRSLGVAVAAYLDRRRRRLLRPLHPAERLGHRLRRRADRCWSSRPCAAPPAGSCRSITACFLLYAFFGAVPAARRGRTRATRSRASSATCT